MQIVIDINDEIYKEILSGKDGWSNYVHGLIRTGTPLPKGHGRLMDERQVVMALIYRDFLKDNVKCGDITKILDRATIIEADTESEEQG